MRKGQRPSRHVRCVRTKGGLKLARVNVHIRKRELRDEFGRAFLASDRLNRFLVEKQLEKFPGSVEVNPSQVMGSLSNDEINEYNRLRRDADKFTGVQTGFAILR